MSIRSLLKLNKGFKIPLGSLKAIFVEVSQNFIKSHLKFCLISQLMACMVVKHLALVHKVMGLAYTRTQMENFNPAVNGT